jgi:hypothetical protein
MKSILFLCILFLNVLYAQEFTPGYYIINSSATYAVINPSSSDFYENENGCLEMYELLQMKSGEVVMAYELNKGRYYCYDPNGRIIMFQGANCLTKAPIVPGAGIGHMLATIQLIDGSSLSEGAYYWIIGQNISNSTIKIQVADGQTYDVPQEKIMLLSAEIRNYTKDFEFSPVEN